VARRVFFSFDFTHDVFRANQVRMANVVGVERAGYYDHSEYEEAKKKGALAIKRMILSRLKDTTVTVVLIGTRTATRPWVRFEVQESVRRGNGLLGIRIHHLPAPPPGGTNLPRQMWHVSPPGPLPIVPRAMGFPVYNWDSDLEHLRREIEAAWKRGESLRARRRVAAAVYQRPTLPAPVLQPPPRSPYPGLFGGAPPSASPFRLSDNFLSSLGRPSWSPDPPSFAERLTAERLTEAIRKQRR